MMAAVSREHIEDAIRDILVSELELEPASLTSISATTGLLGRGIGLDSIDALTLISALEKQFDLEVEDAELTVGLFKTIRTLAEFILGKISQRHPCAAADSSR